MRLLFIMVVCGVLCACTPRHMVEVGACPKAETIKPVEGKAMIVMAHSVNYTFALIKGVPFAVNFHAFLDDKHIGSNMTHSMFIAQIEPGTHYLTTVYTPNSVVDNFANLTPQRMDFKAGHLYFYHVDAKLSFKTSLEAITATQMTALMGEDCTLFEIDKNNPRKNLTPDEYADIQNTYQEANQKAPTD